MTTINNDLYLNNLNTINSIYFPRTTFSKVPEGSIIFNKNDHLFYGFTSNQWVILVGAVMSNIDNLYANTILANNVIANILTDNHLIISGNNITSPAGYAVSSNLTGNYFTNDETIIANGNIITISVWANTINANI